MVSVRIWFILLITILAGCVHKEHKSKSYPPDALCVNVQQKMLQYQNAASFIPSFRTVTSTEKANLLRQYNQLGCHVSSDNRYALPNESLSINKTINETPASKPAIYHKGLPTPQ